MADTDTETLPNGNATLSAEEEERLKQRPADIDADVREMERRKRVEALMSSRLFREELERVLDQQMSEGNDAPLLQRIREMVGGRLHTGSMRGPSCVLPINDIRGIEGIGYEKGEKILRCKLAAVYRLVDLFGWTQTGMSGQITARLNTALEQVLTTPRGLLPHEVTASSLVKLDMQGTVHDRGTTNFTVNVDGFSLHAAVHSARPDVRCVLHVRSPATLAVSAMRRGLLPLCHEAAALGELAYHRVPTGILDNDEKDKLVRALGPHAKVLVLSSAGALCCGATLEEAFHQARCLTAACDVQLRLASVPTEELSLLDEETRRQIYESTHKPPSDSTKWRVGGEEFEALMRMLDNAGFRTGYIYRNPLIKNDVPKPKNDVEVPPAVSSLGYLLEEEELYKQGIWKKGHGKTGERTRWLNTPNVYQKVEVLETGTNEPKKITKWVDANNEEWIQDGSPAHSGTPVKIDTLQFVPKNTNPKEFKALQQQIKDNRRADKISAGPQSHILEGVTWDEASKLVGEDAINTHTGDHVVLMGAASKGIIQRGYQHNARVYSAPYARNPFDHVSEKELAEYTRRVGARDYDTDLSESEALSAAQVTSPASAHSETEEESRDEHRVLRIETKQAPVRSQPEVVLSDVDTTDFLNAERSHSERTKEREPTPQSDDEVFLESAVTSSVTSPVIAVRTQVVHQTVARGAAAQGTKLTEANPNEAFSTSKRSLHEYSRNAAFDSVVKKFDSPERVVDAPKCKVSLNYGNNFEHNIESNNLGSRSSLSSIPSIEWDGRCRSEYGLRTRSLPRQRVNNSNRLYRTRSHGGFINSYIKDPEPLHYHVPKCRSCGASNVSYAGDVYKDKRSKGCMSMYLSLDNIHQKCVEEKNDKVEVKEMIVPVFKVAKEETEFVESQEFNEEIYLGDIGNSFSSDNMTVIEKCLDSKHDIMIDHNVNGVNDVIIVNDGTNKTQYVNTDIYRAELVTVEENAEVIHNTSLDSVEGEYHSFSEEMDFAEAVYESPVKDLVEKDIRDYSVPIDFYCEDFSKKDDNSPKKSPLKRRDVLKTNQLEPILEESKSSYGDDSCNDSGSKKNSDESTASVVKDIQPKFEDALDDNVSTLISEKENENKDITENLILENTKDSISNGLDTYIQEINIETSDKVVDITAKDVSTKESSINKEDDVTRPSLISIDSSILARKSCEATVEFEKYEIIVDILTTVLNRIDTENANDEFVYIHKPLDIKTHFQIDATEGDGLYVTDAKLDVEMDKDKTNNENSEVNIASLDNLLKEIGVPLHLLPDENQPQNVRYSILDSDAKDNSGDIFCMAEIVKDMERNLNLNETALTESSDTEAIQSQKIVEAVLYYILDRVYFTWANKNKKIKSKQNKTVVTVVDYEDILFTSVPLWLEVDLDNANRTNNNINEDVKDAAQKTIETCLNDDMANYIREDSIAYVNNNVSNNEELVCEDFNHNIVCENNYEVIEEGYNESSVIDVNNNDMEYDINTDEGVSYTMDLNETLDELYEDSSDNLVPYHDIRMIALDIVNSVIENGMLLFEDGEDSLLNINEAEKSLEGSDSYVVSTNMVNENNVAEIINDVTQSINERQRSDVDNVSNETFVLEEHDMNVAFVEDEVDTSYFNSRSSSPHKEMSAFEICTESPIRMANDTIIVNENLNSLYEKDETILGSPFVKQAPVISMSQTVNSGGIKYWLSFDDSLSNSVTQHKPTYRAIRSYEDSKTPSFVTVKFDKNDANNKYFEYKKDSFKPASVLLDEYNNSGDSLKTDEVYDSAHASNTDYNTCESDVDPKLSESMETPQKMLLYDSRYYLHAKASKRHYTSWPPFEHTLFYRIISRFRMSDSFDPSDLDDTRCDSI